MAKPALQSVKQETKAAPAFVIDNDIAPPPRTKELPEYGLQAVFDKMTKGQSVLIPFAAVPVEHTRIYAQRFARGKKGEAKIDITTRTEKDAEGNEIGLRVWRNS